LLHVLMEPNSVNTPIAPRLGLWDAVSIIVGIVVGTSIFRTPAIIFDKAGGGWTAIGLWLFGGMLAWCGAVCYAELATTYPRDGGDYEYLNRAYGPWCGFLFSWAQLTTVISGNIAIMAYAFADYAARLWPAGGNRPIAITVAPVIVLSALNLAGVEAGKVTQNLLTATKIIGLSALVVAGLLVQAKPQAEVTNIGQHSASLGLALVFVLYAYGGWAHAAYVAAELRDQRRNLPRALMLGIVGITVVYLAVNGAYLAGLGYDRVRHAQTPAADVMELAVGPWGGRAVSLVVMLSALGAINGMILTGTRIYAVWGADYPALAWLGAWNRRSGAPISAILVQAMIAVVLILLVGTEMGRDTFDATLRRVGLSGMPWEEYFGGFETLIAGSAPIFWGLCLLTGAGLFVLRAKDPARERPFRVPLYPLPAVAFCGTCVFMLWSSLMYARWLSLIGFIPLALGSLLWFALRTNRRHRAKD
jgi:amino acid transporter